MFEIRQLQCFITVVEELNFRRAATRMHMTQPPLSRQIRLLEHEIQVQLFERTSRSVKLTPAGRAFFRARRLLALADNASFSAQRIARGESGVLNIGFTAGSSYSFLPKKLLALTNTYLKSVDIVLHEMLTRDQFEALHAHALDISVLRRAFEAPSIELTCVAREMMLAVPLGHRLAKGRMPTIADLKGSPSSPSVS